MKDPKIYADAYQAVIQVFHRTKNIPKALRPTIGRKVEESVLSCLLNIRKATLSTGPYRMKHLISASESLDELRILIQLLKDLNAINVAGLSELSEITRQIGMELGGFIKHEKRQNSP